MDEGKGAAGPSGMEAEAPLRRSARIAEAKLAEEPLDAWIAIMERRGVTYSDNGKSRKDF